MQKKAVQIAVAAALGVTASAAQAVTINWLDGIGAGNTTPFPSAINSSPFTTTPVFPPPNPRNSEFRMIDPGGAVGGGGEKSIIDGVGDESWTFDAAGALTGTGAAFPSNPGAFAGAAPSASTNPTLNQNAPFFGPAFNFLAPTTTSLAGAAYGTGTISFTSGDNFSMFFPVMEAQWGGTYFPLGIKDGGVGITFSCNGALSGNVRCTAEHTIDASQGEDPGVAGFNGWTAQWDLYGTMTPHTPEVPVPAAVWLFGSGLVGLVGVARRRKRTV